MRSKEYPLQGAGKNSISKWINTGYKHFADYGPGNLVIKNIAKEAGVARTGFYYIFRDMDEFISYLLERHWQITMEYLGRIRNECNSLYPDLFMLISQYPLSFKFQKQLFLHRSEKIYNEAFEKGKTATHEAIMSLVIKHLKATRAIKVTEKLFWNLTDTWYSKIDFSNASAEEMEQKSRELMVLLEKIKE